MNDIWAEVMVDAFRDMIKLVALFLPKLLASVSFIVLGIVIGLTVKAILQRLLKALRIDVLGERWGLQGVLVKAGFKQPLSEIVGRLAFWMLFLVFIFMGVDALDLPATTGMISHLLSFFPHIVAASLLLLVGVLLANFFAEATLIASVNAQIYEARMIANFVRWGILLFTAAMVLTQLGIAKEIVVAAFSIVFGGVVLALAIAVGLGGRNIARDALERRWRRKTEEEHDEMVHL